MGLKLYNTFTRKVESFQPIDNNKVRLYSCGPTIYDFAHIGNFRAFIFIDLLKRILKFSGYEVNHVMNITDVDDRIIKKCGVENISISELTPQYLDAFYEDMYILGIEPAEYYPLATEHITDMIKLIEKLVGRKHAYITNEGSVFFDITSFVDYGKLSKISADSLKQTDRVSSDEYEKENPTDFALWKAWKPEDGDVGWNSPWGRGRPGWHIECSAMSMKYLGEYFDIHCGGTDLMFPHHENEIAQSVGATGNEFVNIWLHCEHLLVNNTKMSKSLGNYFTLKDLLKKGFAPETLRYFLLTTHYRQKINLTFEHLDAAASSVKRLRDFSRRLELLAGESKGKTYAYVEENFLKVMNEDLNISAGLAVIFNWIRGMNRYLDSNSLSSELAGEALILLKRFDMILNVIFEEGIVLNQKDSDLIKEREVARQNKHWTRADEIREYFLKKNITLEDTAKGTVVKRNIKQ